MRKAIRFRVAISLLGLAGTVATEAEDSFSNVIRPVFEQHCVKCHGKDGKVKGKVNLLEIKDLSSLANHPELVADLIEALDFQEMPPEDEPALDPAQRQILLQELEAVLKQSISEKKAFTHSPIRRMNRAQYNNAVIDLFKLNCTVFSLPEQMMREHKNYFQPDTGKMAESVLVGSRPLGKSQTIEPRLDGAAPFPQDLRAEHGFDNRGDHLSLSPLLMESFLKLSQSITQSPDFTARNVGIWKDFFLPPTQPENHDPKVQARARIRSFLFRAFRRPVSDSVVDRYTDYAAGKMDSGSPYTEVMKSVAAAAIASPRFLYLYDICQPNEDVATLDDFELASRLSFFLWGSIPDQALLDLAAAGELGKPEILEAQFSRMMADDKLKRFCDSFPSQWLQLEKIISSIPDMETFPDFYFLKYRKSMHMMLEPLLIFETVLVENLPITQLIDSDFTYRSAMLRKHYGESIVAKDDVTVLKFDRVPVTDRRFGGVITNAAIMTMTSGPERTQPITRGAWLAGVIFNDPPEPPPADVPVLGEKPAAGEEHLTLRERLAAHRERSDCRGCHEQIDPLGFALENFDPVGAWRDKYENGRDIDMSGTLFRKHEFASVIEFKDAILAEKDRFTRGFAAHLMSFALARKLGAADSPALDKIADTTAADGYKIQTLLKAIIFSEPFLSKTNPNPTKIAKAK
ncbi:MAG: DUF1592 domain-containing protein [Verrucomicrobia bacterium]|nr:DUF1592 domain-containing protein [Verrucomicrobiota bacterium]